MFHTSARKRFLPSTFATIELDGDSKPRLKTPKKKCKVCQKNLSRDNFRTFSQVNKNCGNCEFRKE